MQLKKSLVLLIPFVLFLLSCSDNNVVMETSHLIVESTTRITETTISTITTYTTTTESVSTEPQTIVEEDTTEPFTPAGSLKIRDQLIWLTFGRPTQDLVDTSDVVYSTNVDCWNNIILLGHDYRSFSILSSVEEGEAVLMNVDGEVKFYEVQQSERAYTTNQETKLYFFSDVNEENEILTTNYYDLPALVMITCYENNRWVVLAKEIA